MDVKCPICDRIDDIDYNSPLAKKLRNRRKHLYLCKECSERIAKNTEARHRSGDFKLYEEKYEDDPYLS